MKGKRISS